MQNLERSAPWNYGAVVRARRVRQLRLEGQAVLRWVLQARAHHRMGKEALRHLQLNARR